MPVSSNLIYNIEQELMQNISSRLAMLGDLEEPNYTTEWARLKLSELNKLEEDNIRTINKSAKKTINAVGGDIQEAGVNAVEAIEGDFLKAKSAGYPLNTVLPYAEEPSLRALVQSFTDVGETNAKLIINNMNQSASQVYINTINKTVQQVNLGISTPQVALRQTIREWSKSGLPVFIDSAGRTWTAESYYNTVLRSTIRNVTTDIQFKRMAQYGTDLIEISSHVSARPGCEPYQSKVYSRSGQDEKYPAFSSTTYGEPSGILGVNCRHQIYPFFEGISTTTFDRPNTKENDKEYKLSQQQRRLETSIKHAKREKAVYKANKDVDATKKANELIKDRNTRLEKFLDETGRTRRSNRELIYSV